jgi:hypothetical protein
MGNEDVFLLGISLVWIDKKTGARFSTEYAYPENQPLHAPFSESRLYADGSSCSVKAKSLNPIKGPYDLTGLFRFRFSPDKNFTATKCGNNNHSFWDVTFDVGGRHVICSFNADEQYLFERMQIDENCFLREEAIYATEVPGRAPDLPPVRFVTVVDDDNFIGRVHGLSGFM